MYTYKKPLICSIYPNKNHFYKSGAYYMLEKQNVEYTTRLRDKHDFAFFWDPGLKLKKNTPKMKAYVKQFKKHLINHRVRGTSKDYIGEKFNKIFGYKLKVDPLTHVGWGVEKNNNNGLKYGEKIMFPLRNYQIKPNHSYQRYIDSHINKKVFIEYRVPIFGNIIPLVFKKRRLEEFRFTANNRVVSIMKTLEIFSEEEADKIIYFCKSINLEYGELDILRENQTDRLYIVDVNNTPWFPCNKLSGRNKNIALNMFWNAFLESFNPQNFDKYHIPDEKIDDYEILNYLDKKELYAQKQREQVKKQRELSKKQKEVAAKEEEITEEESDTESELGSEPEIEPFPYSEYKYVSYVGSDFDYSILEVDNILEEENNSDEENEEEELVFNKKEEEEDVEKNSDDEAEKDDEQNNQENLEDESDDDDGDADVDIKKLRMLLRPVKHKIKEKS